MTVHYATSPQLSTRELLKYHDENKSLVEDFLKREIHYVNFACGNKAEAEGPTAFSYRFGTKTFVRCFERIRGEHFTDGEKMKVFNNNSSRNREHSGALETDRMENSRDRESTSSYSTSMESESTRSASDRNRWDFSTYSDGHSYVGNQTHRENDRENTSIRSTFARERSFHRARGAPRSDRGISWSGRGAPWGGRSAPRGSRDARQMRDGVSEHYRDRSQERRSEDRRLPRNRE